MVPEFNIEDVMSASVSAHRLNRGFIKKDQIRLDSEYEGAISNAQLLYRHFFQNETLDITNDDRNTALEIIDYLKGLSFKAIERKLTDFEKNVLSIVTSPTIIKQQIGIAASLPKVYYNKLEQDDWSSRELELSRTSVALGKIRERGNFVAKVEFNRYIPKTMSYLVTASVDNKSILKFFSDKKQALGKEINISGYVKSQSEGRYHSGMETIINRIKIEESND
tara:strand:- start:1290 stop:1958 length:669 start_codon:yes stop_codon:yes gene_type:complete